MQNDTCFEQSVHQDRVEKALLEAVTPDQMDRLVRIFKLLSEPTRLKIVLALNSVEMCVCDLAAYLGASQSSVSHQLCNLHNFGLVCRRREGQTVYYSLGDEHVSQLLAIGMAHAQEV